MYHSHQYTHEQYSDISSYFVLCLLLSCSYIKLSVLFYHVVLQFLFVNVVYISYILISSSTKLWGLHIQRNPPTICYEKKLILNSFESQFGSSSVGSFVQTDSELRGRNWASTLWARGAEDVGDVCFFRLSPVFVWLARTRTLVYLYNNSRLLCLSLLFQWLLYEMYTVRNKLFVFCIWRVQHLLILEMDQWGFVTHKRLSDTMMLHTFIWSRNVLIECLYVKFVNKLTVLYNP